MTLILGLLLLVTAVLFAACIRWQKACAVLRTELMGALEQQREAQAELSRRSTLDDLKDEFVSTVSHELRTPLTSIRGALGLLSSGIVELDDAKSKNLLRIAVTNTDRLIRLINDILDLERMSSGRAVLQISRCSLADLMHHASETMSAMAEAAQVKLAITPSENSVLPSVFFDGDPDRILQVLVNLLSNAIKFSPEGSTVAVEVETPPNALVFRVIDQGRGIPEDQLESIFERFKQVEHADAQQRGGTGLGLAICRSIIQQHGGTIWAQRNPVRGASVCVKLPRLQRTYDATIPPLPRVQGEPAMNAGGRADAVLVCDDDPKHRALIAKQLRGRGYSVLEASSSEEAIEIAERQPIDDALQAILIDLQMSGMKGWDILRVLTRNSRTAAIPIVVLSVERPPEAIDALSTSSLAQPEEQFFANLSRALDNGRGPSHVLLVEDDEDLADVVIEGFLKSDVNAGHASTLQQAKARCKERRPDLIILDLTLPDGDGFAFVDWLRGDALLRSLPLVVYSGREVSAEERTKLRLGPTRFLTKARVHARDVEQLVLRMVDGRNKVTLEHDFISPEALAFPVAIPPLEPPQMRI